MNAMSMIAASLVAPPSLVSSIDPIEAEFTAQARQWGPGQTWECRDRGSDGEWRTLPRGHRPGWFFDTEYRLLEGL